MKVAAIVNPHSSGGKTRRAWLRFEPRVREALGEVDTRYTDAPGAGERLAREALQDGAELVIAVGGDGTIHEVVNGFFDGDTPLNPNAALGLLSSGTGSDFRRTFKLPTDLEGQLQRLIEGNERTIDLGRLTYVNWEGHEARCYFNNITSFGLGGHIVTLLNGQRFIKIFGGKVAFYVAMLRAAFGFTNQRVHLEVDGEDAGEHTMKTVAVCNGQYFGGSMLIAPHAKPDDGQFEVVILGDGGFSHMVMKSGKVYTGEHLKDPLVSTLSGRKIVARPVDPSEEILLDVDGEGLGMLPATLEVVPGALRIRC